MFENASNSFAIDQMLPLLCLASVGFWALILMLSAFAKPPHPPRESQPRARTTPLMLAAMKGDESKVASLLAANPELALDVDGQGRDPLMIAASRGHEACARRLAAHSDLSRKDCFFLDAIGIASTHGHHNLATWLGARDESAAERLDIELAVPVCSGASSRLGQGKRL